MIRKFLARALVVLKALPTHMIALATALVWLAPELGRLFPDRAETISAVTIRVIAALGAAVTIIRRVTPVDSPDQIGILPQGSPASPVVTIDQTAPLNTPAE